jgi:predicted transcriptional regulator
MRALGFVETNPSGGAIRIDQVSFGRITIDGITYEHDMIIDDGRILTRTKKASKKCRDMFGHTSLSADEEIPWKCSRLVIGHRGLRQPASHESGKAQGGAT